MTTASHATKETEQLAATTAQKTSAPKLGSRGAVRHTCAAARNDATTPLAPVPAKYALVNTPRKRERYGTNMRFPLLPMTPAAKAAHHIPTENRSRRMEKTNTPSHAYGFPLRLFAHGRSADITPLAATAMRSKTVTKTGTERLPRNGMIMRGTRLLICCARGGKGSGRDRSRGGEVGKRVSARDAGGRASVVDSRASRGRVRVRG